MKSLLVASNYYVIKLSVCVILASLKFTTLNRLNVHVLLMSAMHIAQCTHIAKFGGRGVARNLIWVGNGYKC